jgi:hypothetical protein
MAQAILGEQASGVSAHLIDEILTELDANADRGA